MTPRLTRRQLATFPTRRGFPISMSTLSKLCAPSVGEGPPAAGIWGQRPLYDPDVALEWAEKRMRPVGGDAVENGPPTAPRGA
jgi:hypothetical protein